MEKWVSTSQLASMVEDYYPATPAEIREYCEEGTIPSKFAKRRKDRERGHWKIAVRGIRWILQQVFSLDDEEIAEVESKTTVNFKRSKVA